MSQQLHQQTPLLESHALEEKAGCKVYLKLENCQQPGSFKIRGIGNLCCKEKENGKEQVVCSSGGNAGMAAAYAAKALKMPCKIYVPGSTPQFTINTLKREGAEVEVVGKIWDEANQKAVQHVKSDTKCAYIHPYDHPDIWEGHSSMILEMKEQLGSVNPGCIIVSVGGGGLATGVIIGMDKVGWSDVPLIISETEGANSFNAAVTAGQVVFIPTISSIASSLGSRSICQKLFDFTKTHTIKSVVVSDKQAVNACLQFSGDHRFLVEPACGASLAVVYDHLIPGLLGYKPENLVVIVCGGNSVTIDRLLQWKTQFEL